ncbi:MAG TPA: hypothetical protein VF317_11230 [Dermatophilaceae bacterium]
MTHNEGIIFNGPGRLDADVLAVGRGAHAKQGGLAPAAFEDVDARLVDLIAQIKDRREDLDDGEELADTAESLRSELAKDAPNRVSVKALLEGLVGGVASVTELATLVSSVQTAIGNLF